MTRLVQMADLHFGVEDSRALEMSAEWISGSDVDGIVVCGDLSQRGKRSEFNAAAKWLEQFTVPVLVTPGNHDTPLLDMSARALAPFRRFWRYFEERRMSIDLERARVTAINTSRGWQARRNWAEGSVDLDDLTDALEHLEEAEGLLGVIACHHPFRSPADAPLRISTRRGQRASTLMENSGAQLLLTGHVHTPSAEVWRGEAGAYLNLTCGTLSQRLRAAPPSFNVIDVGDDKISAWSMACEKDGMRATPMGGWTRAHLEPTESDTVPS